MVNTFENVTDYIEFLITHKMDTEQFLVCYLVYTEKYDDLRKYLKKLKRIEKRKLDDLVERGYLIDLNTTGSDDSPQTYINKYLTTPKLEKAIFVDTDVAGAQLWDLYPAFIDIDGKRIPARSTNKDKLFELYMSKIGNSCVKHEQILELLAWSIGTSGVTMGIQKWVESEHWSAIAEQKNNTFDGSGYGEQEV